MLLPQMILIISSLSFFSSRTLNVLTQVINVKIIEAESKCVNIKIKLELTAFQNVERILWIHRVLLQSVSRILQHFLGNCLENEISPVAS